MAKTSGQIRSVLIPITGGRVLLPNATVAEVITFANPDPVADSPEWMMGRVVWRGWRVPVFSLSVLDRWAEQESLAGAKIAVLKALGGHKDMPFLAMVTQGFPRLVTISDESLEAAPPEEEPDVQASNPAETFDVEMDDNPLEESIEDPASEAGQAEKNFNPPDFNPIQSTVMLNGERAAIPDLQAIERLVLEVL